MPGETPSSAPVLIRLRYPIMAASLILFLPPLSAVFQLTQDVNFCGRWCPRMFFVWREGSNAATYFAGWLRSWPGVALVTAVLVTTLFFGRYWCSHLCPIGGAMELSSRVIPSRIKIDFSSVPGPAFRYSFLFVFLAAPALGIGSLCCSYCNFAAVPRAFGGVFSEADLMYFLRAQGIINLALVVFLGLFAIGGRAYCNLLCPLGALDALLARIGSRRGRRVLINSMTCSGCGACFDECPTWAIETLGNPTINQLSCIPCRRCETVCPHGAISYGRLSILTPADAG